MIDRIIDGVKEAMFRPINKSASVILAVFSLLWGFWLANPFWSVFYDSAVFEVMQVLPESVWGVAAMVIGFSMILGQRKDRFVLLKWASRIGFYFWLFVSLCAFTGHWQAPDGILTLMVAIYSGYVALNLSINTDYFVEQ